MENKKELKNLYLIQLFDDNCPSCTSGVTEVYTEDIEHFAACFCSLSRDNEQVERFLQSKNGAVVTDYYSDDPQFNIVTRFPAKVFGMKEAKKEDQLITTMNGYGYDCVYHFDRLSCQMLWVECRGKYLKLVKAFGKGCCSISEFEDEMRYRKLRVYGNPFWIYREDGKIASYVANSEHFAATCLEAYVWQVADVFETEEEIQEDMKMDWLTKEQICNTFLDLPGDAG